MYDNPTPSVVDTLLSQRGQLPINPKLGRVDSGEPFDPGKAFAQLFGSITPQPATDQKSKADAGVDPTLGWLYDSPAPNQQKNQDTGAAATNATQTAATTQKPTLPAYTAPGFEVGNLNFWSDTVTPDTLSGAIGELYKSGQIKTQQITPEMVAKFAQGDYSDLSTMMATAQQDAHRQAVIGVLNLLPSLMATQLSKLFNDYTSHREFASAHQQGVGNQEDPIMRLVMDAAINKFRTQNPNAGRDKILEATKGIEGALRKKYSAAAAAASNAQKPAATQTDWAEFLQL